jgi:hypothetical protein
MMNLRGSLFSMPMFLLVQTMKPLVLWSHYSTFAFGDGNFISVIVSHININPFLSVFCKVGIDTFGLGVLRFGFLE